MDSPPQLPHPTWAEFENIFFPIWEQGEHVFISSQTGGGKTELLLKLMRRRDYGVIFCTKPRDPIFKTPEAREYKRVKSWDDIARDKFSHKFMLAPQTFPTPDQTRAVQTAEFRYAIESAYHSGHWAIGGDETAWMSESLGLSRELADIHHMGRALGITAITATQRPKRLPVIIPQSASYAFVGKTMRADDMKTLSELGGDTRATARAIDTLTGRHDFLFIDTLSRIPLAVVNTRA